MEETNLEMNIGENALKKNAILALMVSGSGRKAVCLLNRFINMHFNFKVNFLIFYINNYNFLQFHLFFIVKDENPRLYNEMNLGYSLQSLEKAERRNPGYFQALSNTSGVLKAVDGMDHVRQKVTEEWKKEMKEEKRKK